jgi:AraC-like DNA-binding protein/ligand-binding sensor protein
MKNSDTEMIQRLGHSNLYSDFKQAFGASTGLPLTLRPLEFWQLAHCGQPYENPFCAMIAQTNCGCSASLETEQRSVDAARDRSATVRCFADLCHTAVPIKLGEHTIGYLVTGQVAQDLPSPHRFEAIARQLTEWGVPIDRKRLEDAYYHCRVLSSDRYAGLIRLLEIFGQQLSAMANRLMVQNTEAEPPMVRRARAYITGHQADPIDLDNVAKAMHVSTFYFCKMFKKATGLTFTEYLGRVRVEKAKTLLLNPHLRISEIAYDVGFQSLTHFNRVFREITGEAPTAFRDNGTSRIDELPRNRSRWAAAPVARSHFFSGAGTERLARV